MLAIPTKYKDMFYGLLLGVGLLVIGVGGYLGYQTYWQHQMLWQWAPPIETRLNGLEATFKKLAGNANIKSLFLQQTRLDKVEARLDKLEAPPQTEAEESEPEGEGE